MATGQHASIKAVRNGWAKTLDTEAGSASAEEQARILKNRRSSECARPLALEDDKLSTAQDGTSLVPGEKRIIELAPHQLEATCVPSHNEETGEITMVKVIFVNKTDDCVGISIGLTYHREGGGIKYDRQIGDAENMVEIDSENLALELPYGKRTEILLRFENDANHQRASGANISWSWVPLNFYKARTYKVLEGITMTTRPKPRGGRLYSEIIELESTLNEAYLVQIDFSPCPPARRLINNERTAVARIGPLSTVILGELLSLEGDAGFGYHPTVKRAFDVDPILLEVEKGVQVETYEIYEKFEVVGKRVFVKGPDNMIVDFNWAKSNELCKAADGGPLIRRVKLDGSHRRRFVAEVRGPTPISLEIIPHFAKTTFPMDHGLEMHIECDIAHDQPNFGYGVFDVRISRRIDHKIQPQPAMDATFTLLEKTKLRFLKGGIANSLKIALDADEVEKYVGRIVMERSAKSYELVVDHTVEIRPSQSDKVRIAIERNRLSKQIQQPIRVEAVAEEAKPMQHVETNPVADDISATRIKSSVSLLRETFMSKSTPPSQSSTAARKTSVKEVNHAQVSKSQSTAPAANAASNNKPALSRAGSGGKLVDTTIIKVTPSTPGLSRAPSWKSQTQTRNIPTISPVLIRSTEKDSAGQPCSRFQIDVLNKGYLICVCGHSKASHL